VAEPDRNAMTGVQLWHRASSSWLAFENTAEDPYRLLGGSATTMWRGVCASYGRTITDSKGRSLPPGLVTVLKYISHFDIADAESKTCRYRCCWSHAMCDEIPYRQNFAVPQPVWAQKGRSADDVKSTSTPS